MTSPPQRQCPITRLPATTDDQIDGIELRANTNTEFPEQTIDLPPIDGGTRAWCLLLAAFVFEALLWGFPLSFGVFQEYYSHLPQFQNNSYVSAIGTTASGISYLGAPVATALTQRWSRYRTQMILLGWPLCIAGLVAGSFADTLGMLLLTQGVLYGIGFVIFYYPIISMIDEYWVRRRGMAYGILCSSSGVSGAVTPIVIQKCLHRFGYQTTLRGVAVLLTVTTGPLIPMLKGRYRHDMRQVASLRTDWNFLKKRIFWTYSMSNLWMGLGYFFPAVFLPSYATLIGIGASKGALLLAIMCLSQVAGQFTFGFLSDKHVSVDALVAVASSVSAIVTLSIWGLARSFLPLAFFAMLYGFFGAGYTAMYARMVTKVSNEPSSSQVMFGFFCAGKGIGNILTGPLSAGLLRLSSSSSRYGYGAYQAVIVFTGTCLLMSVISLGFMYLKPSVRIAALLN